MKKGLVLFLSLVLCVVFISSSVYAAGGVSTDEEEIKNVIVDFYEEFYDAWYSLEYNDFSDVLNPNSVQCCNKIITLTRVIDRWKYLISNGLYKGQRDKLSLAFQFDSICIYDDYAVVSVNITHDENDKSLVHSPDGMCAFPFFVSFGANQFGLVKIDGKWLIDEHEYEDVWFYEESVDELITYDRDSDMADLESEYSVEDEGIDICAVDPPYTGVHQEYAYSPTRAVSYAYTHCESPNSIFYEAPEDCTNFVSQCISYGFGSSSSYSSLDSFRMVSGTYSTGWYADAGGGSAAWESVTAHWNYMTSDKANKSGPRVVLIPSIGNICDGDVMQIDFQRDGGYDHSVICVDAVNGTFAQHSGDHLGHINDYTGNKRIYRPTYFWEY